MLKERKELEQSLIEVIQTSNLKTQKRKVNDIKKHLASNYNIIDVQGWLNDPESKLPELDIRELLLFSEQIYSKSDVEEINPINYFTENEFKEARRFNGLLNNQEEINFPLTFSNATVVGNNAYMVTMSIKTITKLLNNNLIYYNFETQREAKFVKRKDKIIIEPTLNKNSVKEITEHLLQGTLVPTVLVFNCETRSTDDASGEEIIYNSKNLELTITKGTRVSITDGFHRITASRNALQIDPELDFNFAVLLTNYNTKKAQQYMAQISKANAISKTRIAELEAKRLSDNVMQQIREESELKGRISHTNRIHSLNRELTTYKVLADTIDEEFKLETKIDAMNVGDFLVSYFDHLIGSYPNEFINKIEETRANSLINDSNMFVGYVVLARKMFEAKIPAKEVREYIKDIDFSKEYWKSKGILDKNGNLERTPKVRKQIKQFFNDIEIKKK